VLRQRRYKSRASGGRNSATMTNSFMGLVGGRLKAHRVGGELGVLAASPSDLAVQERGGVTELLPTEDAVPGALVVRIDRH
jgi:hypothetical protein